MERLEVLDRREKELLLDAPVLVSLLAAAQDGIVDRKEKRDAIELSHLRTFTAEEALTPYYKAVETNFVLRFDVLEQRYAPFDENAREEIRRALDQAFQIAGKLDRGFAEILKRSLKSYAKHVMSVHPQLSEVLDLSILK